MKLASILFAFMIYSQLVFSQSKVAITIDDVPNTALFEQSERHSPLLEELDSLSIPVAIFINEGLIYTTGDLNHNFALLHDWIKRSYTLVGNHTFNHKRYSTTPFERYMEEIVQGEAISKAIAKKYDKSLNYLRLPFNDLGKDSLQHQQLREYVTSLNYDIAPFTVESSDWMYNAVYEWFLNAGETRKAQEIGEAYVDKTLEYFEFFESITLKHYGRAIPHIYLCHDSRINADYLSKIILKLKERSYTFVSLEDALVDPVYQQTDYYTQKWGISWVYRWMKEHEDRIALMKQEPDIKELIKQYGEISQQ